MENVPKLKKFSLQIELPDLLLLASHLQLHLSTKATQVNFTLHIFIQDKSQATSYLLTVHFSNPQTSVSGNDQCSYITSGQLLDPFIQCCFQKPHFGLRRNSILFCLNPGSSLVVLHTSDLAISANSRAISLEILFSYFFFIFFFKLQHCG